MIKVTHKEEVYKKESRHERFLIFFKRKVELTWLYGYKVTIETDSDVEIDKWYRDNNGNTFRPTSSRTLVSVYTVPKLTVDRIWCLEREDLAFFRDTMVWMNESIKADRCRCH